MVNQLALISRDNNGKPQLGFDLEADNLGRNGTTAYLQLRDYTKGQTYLIDLWHLGRKAFTTRGEDKKTTLKSILEDPMLIMLIADSRSDADTLNWQYGVKAQGVMDVQVLHILTEKRSLGLAHPRRRYVELIEAYAGLRESDLKNWHEHKDHDFDNYPGIQLAQEWSQKETAATWDINWSNPRSNTAPFGIEACWKQHIQIGQEDFLLSDICMKIFVFHIKFRLHNSCYLDLFGYDLNATAYPSHGKSLRARDQISF
ncbi:hypothetical protein LTR66_016639 [Elasticomyces elasticus]|nr:hypothetical protein LTR66_016639 [Elasticomyces elasticus]